MKVVTLSQEELQEVVSKSVEKAIDQKLPDVLRKANKKVWLLPVDIEREYGISRRSQAYLRDTLRVPFRKVGAKILVNRNEIESYLERNTVTVEDE